MMTLFANKMARLGLKPKEAERFFKFLVVGTIGFVLDFGLLTFLVEIFGLWTILANTISFSAAVVSNFTWNRYWTYPESRSKKKRVQLPQFAMVSVMGLLLNNFILFILHSPFDKLLLAVHAPPAIQGYMPAKIIATVVVLFWNFYINRYWTYGHVS